MDLSRFGNALDKAWTRRAGLRARTDAFRLLNGAASGVPGLIIDSFAGYLVAYAYAKEPWLLQPGFAEKLAAVTGARGLSLIDRGAKGEEGREEGRILFGEVPESVEVREGGLRFRVYPRHPRNAGLFLDTRKLREALASECPRHDALNLFSYSCSLGIAAASGNAGEVVNVDVSARYLGWGKANLALNNFPAERMRFVKMDSGKYLAWAEKKGLAFDVVILDPPSFSRSEAGIFSFAKDYFRLAGACARLLRSGGRLIAMTNFGGITPARFKAQLAETLRDEGRRAAQLKRVELPEDFDGAEATGSAPDPSARPAAVEGTLLGWDARLD